MSPAAVNDYPRTWSEFLDWFSSEEACLAYLERLRWPLGFVCPSCATMAAPSRASRGRLLCKDCGHQSTVTAGTIFDKTRTPLKVWLAAAWYVTNQKQGVNALGLQRVLGLGSYQTAWTMLHRFRRAMVRPDRERLKGVVEVDETYVAIADRKRTEPRARGKGKTDKVSVVVAVEMLEPKGFGRIRLRRIAKESTEHVVPFVQASIEPGAKVRTDGSAIYRSLQSLGYAHERTVQLGSDVATARINGRRAPGRLADQALDSWHTPWLGSARAPGRLSRRVRVPLQSPNFELSRDALLQVDAASRRHRSGDLRGDIVSPTGETAEAA
jgi:transposase-like protein